MNKKLRLKKGDIITYIVNETNEEASLIIDGYDGATVEDFEEEEVKVINIERPVKYETIYEYKEILDDVEREYLGDFINPFRNKVDVITKLNNGEGSEWIIIELKNEQPILLPYFKQKTMYKGMELNKEYTLEELGL